MMNMVTIIMTMVMMTTNIMKMMVVKVLIRWKATDREILFNYPFPTPELRYFNFKIQLTKIN